MSPFPEMVRQASKPPSSSSSRPSPSTATVAVPTRSRSGRRLRGEGLSGEGPSSPSLSPPNHGRFIKVTVIKGSSTTSSTSSAKRRLASTNGRKSSPNGRKRGQSLLESTPPTTNVKNGLNGGSELNQSNRKAANESAPRNLSMISINCTEEGCTITRANKGDLAVHLWMDHSIRAFRCLVKACGASYSTRTQLNKHLRGRHRAFTTNWPCGKCEATCRNHVALQAHTRYYHETGSFACTAPGCDFSTAGSRANARGHLATHAGEGGSPAQGQGQAQATPSSAARVDKEGSGEGPEKHHVLILSLDCPVQGCPEVRKTREDLEAHLRAKHGVERYRCLVDEQCTASFRHSADLLRHFTESHSPEARLNGRSPSVIVLENNLPCAACGRFCRSLKELLSHFKSNHEFGRFKCSYYICGYELEHSTRKAMKRHLVNHFPAKYRCRIRGCCGRPFGSKAELDGHHFTPPSMSTRKILINEANQQVGVAFRPRGLAGQRDAALETAGGDRRENQKAASGHRYSVVRMKGRFVIGKAEAEGGEESSDDSRDSNSDSEEDQEEPVYDDETDDGEEEEEDYGQSLISKRRKTSKRKHLDLAAAAAAESIRRSGRIADKESVHPRGGKRKNVSFAEELVEMRQLTESDDENEESDEDGSENDEGSSSDDEPRPPSGLYVCTVKDCPESFNQMTDLKVHMSTHVMMSAKRAKCVSGSSSAESAGIITGQRVMSPSTGENPKTAPSYTPQNMFSLMAAAAVSVPRGGGTSAGFAIRRN